MEASPLVPKKVWEPLPAEETAGLGHHDGLTFLAAAAKPQLDAPQALRDYNDLVQQGLRSIFEDHFKLLRVSPNRRTTTPEGASISHFIEQINFRGLQAAPPYGTNYGTGLNARTFPADARLRGVPYAARLTLEASISLTAVHHDGRTEEKSAEIPSFLIGTFPVMVGSVLCHTHGLTRAAKAQLGEDPSDRGGYFLSGGQEIVIDMAENLTNNMPHCHRGTKPTELVRVEVLSQPPGPYDNSSMVRARLQTDGALTVELSSIKYEAKKIPFYVIFRLFGMTSDREVTEAIVGDFGGPNAPAMLAIVAKAFRLSSAEFAPLVDERDLAKIVQFTAERLVPYIAPGSAYASNESAVQFLAADLLGSPDKPGGFDRVLLPHMGQGAADRIPKLRYLGLLFHRALLVHLGVLPPTDRDSFRSKRVHGAGPSLAKTLKTQFNNSVVIALMKALRRFETTDDFSAITPARLIDLVRTAVASSDLGRALEQAITAGAKTVVIGRRVATNRVSSQALERKNPLNVLCALRSIVSPQSGQAAKQTTRAEDQRKVSQSAYGYVCVAHSADTGEQVGMRKQLAVSAAPTLAEDPLPLRRLLLADPEITPLAAVPPALAHRGGVFLNGVWLGITADPHSVASRYRALRREGRGVPPLATIAVDLVTGALDFWLDVGRLYRPLLFVDNNLAAHDAACLARHAWAAAGGAGPPPPAVPFEQNHRFTPALARALRAGRLGIADLVEAGVAEYVTVEEQANCVVARDFAEVAAARGDVARRFTHCDAPGSIFGFAALVSPYANHTQPARVTYETNQGRQTAGWYALNFPDRVDKNRFFQFRIERPLVGTFTELATLPNGYHVSIAYCPYGGDNQEDSAIICRSAADRGLFEGILVRNVLVELDKGERFCARVEASGARPKANANYSLLGPDGFVRRGSVVRFGDVLVGRVAPNPRARADDPSAPPFVDRSEVYRDREPAFVARVEQPRGANDELFGVVVLHFERPIRTGDKFSSRSGNKSILAQVLPQCDMPFDRNGMTPDIIINTHSIPSRMTVGQLLETLVAVICARLGTTVDGSAFTPFDHEGAMRLLHSFGYRETGRTTLTNGRSGEVMDTAIFSGFILEQRLQKFVLDDMQSVPGSGPTDATTGQPLGGKHVQGGLRLGEMELWALYAQGSVRCVYEKTSTDSDGRTMHLCRGCGIPGVFNPFFGLYQCRTCGECADFAAVETTKAACLFREELAAANIVLRFGLPPRGFLSAGAGAGPGTD